MEQILIAGFGGQGILSTGMLLAHAGMLESKQVAWIPSYGPEMRGGTANCGITIANEDISSPLVTEPTTLIVMNRPSLEKFEKDVVAGGRILINSSLVDYDVKRDDVLTLKIPANKIAEEIGNLRVANNIILGALIQLTSIVTIDSIVESLKAVLPPRRHNMIPANREALERGMQFAKELK